MHYCFQRETPPSREKNVAAVRNERDSARALTFFLEFFQPFGDRTKSITPYSESP